MNAIICGLFLIATIFVFSAAGDIENHHDSRVAREVRVTDLIKEGFDVDQLIKGLKVIETSNPFVASGIKRQVQKLEDTAGRRNKRDVAGAGEMAPPSPRGGPLRSHNHRTGFVGADSYRSLSRRKDSYRSLSKKKGKCRSVGIKDYPKLIIQKMKDVIGSVKVLRVNPDVLVGTIINALELVDLVIKGALDYLNHPEHYKNFSIFDSLSELTSMASSLF